MMGQHREALWVIVSHGHLQWVVAAETVVEGFPGEARLGCRQQAATEDEGVDSAVHVSLHQARRAAEHHCGAPALAAVETDLEPSLGGRIEPLSSVTGARQRDQLGRSRTDRLPRISTVDAVLQRAMNAVERV